MNQKKIAATLCVNRAKPRSCCHGKCYLTKQLSTDEKAQDTPLSGGSNLKFEIVLYSEKKTETRFFVIHDPLVHVSSYKDPISYQAIQAVFHPPQA